MYILQAQAGVAARIMTTPRLNTDQMVTKLWEARYNGPENGHESVAALVVDNSSNVYVTGCSVGSGTSADDYVTIKYTQHGICLGPVVGDLNNDCKVDFKDFAMMASNWLECNYALEEDCL
jgi:hypothetical protein